VKYKDIMKQYNLGPNGAILTSLNLFATRFDQVMKYVDKRAPSLKYALVDTPGQIEIFTWSASGSIITETMASSYPTVVVYVVDTPRTANPTTFMSNMLYACSILYRTRLPLLLVLNKADIVSPQFAMRWLSDFDSFQEALDEGASSYMSDLTRSLSLVLDNFYARLTPIAVSAETGAGMAEFVQALDGARLQFQREYRVPENLKEDLNTLKLSAEDDQKKQQQLQTPTSQ